MVDFIRGDLDKNMKSSGKHSDDSDPDENPGEQWGLPE